MVQNESKADRDARRAKALRDNLRRRKAASRKAKPAHPKDTTPSSP